MRKEKPRNNKLGCAAVRTANDWRGFLVLGPSPAFYINLLSAVLLKGKNEQNEVVCNQVVTGTPGSPGKPLDPGDPRVP